jgi:pimeloyl-ACP methyl ester carboxylesterase
VTLVFLHAFPLDERMWERQVSRFGGVAPRLYGRGNAMEAWAESLLGELEGELTVVGASMGGYCALELARRAPERVRALVLAGARVDADTPERRAGRAGTIRLIREQGPDALWEDMRPKLFADESKADGTLLYREPDGLVAAVEAIRDRSDSTDVARATERLLAVVGEHDSFVSAAELAEFDVREVAGAGHLANLERPDEFDRVLQEFLRG